ncbi:MAG: hypothetical protein II969_04405 [Anaerolineaceae bacterium]|nr:hypothetical protein [Anaerolineaceae bacterium]
MKKIIFLLLALLMSFCSVNADYSFRIPEAQTTLAIESDGSMTIFVEYQFENLGQKLDYVDIGLPNNNYNLKDIVVKLDGEINENIKVTKADYEQTGLRYGISLEMGSDSIPSGGSGVVSVTIPNLRNNLFEATSETIDGVSTEFAGFQYSPNYFNSRFVSGNTKYSFIVIFPPDVSDGYAYYYEPVKWVGDAAPDAWLDEDLCVVYEWYSENADMHTAYTFGGKFIKEVLSSTSNIVSNSSSTIVSNSSFLNIDWDAVLGVLGCIGLSALFIFGTVRSIVTTSKTNKIRTADKYFPPQIKTDGEGIKRGLTAVEAAILLETDLDRVISMILYGLAKKNVIQVKSMDPLDVDVSDPLPEGLNEYEINYISAMQEPNASKKKTAMRDCMHRLILSVSKKIEGFSLKETREYYKNICDKAWEQVEAADTSELKSKLLGDNFGWAMLDDDPEKKVTETFTDYDFRPPLWWWRVDPGYRRPVYYESSSAPTGSSSSSEKHSGSSPSAPTHMPVLPGAMFARSITEGARKLSDSLVGNSKDFKASVKSRSNPDPVYSVSSSSHRHGGGSGGSSCACACACDSCACACAGGGR